VNKVLTGPAAVGVTETILRTAQAGVWDLGAPLRIKMTGGELSSTDRVGVLNGANAMAIGDGSASNWEVFQFAEARVVAPDTYEVSVRLRGQAGSDGLVPSVWPAGSIVVALDQSLTQIDLPLSARGLDRYYRFGIASRGFDDPDVVLRVEAFDGAGLRPYPVGHLRGMVAGNGDLSVTWIRRTRIDGDTWQAVEVPLGEESERYIVRLLQNDILQAEYSVTQPQFLYLAASRLTDLQPGPYRLEVAQISAQYGRGPVRAIDIPG
jgi:hypothetical protein